MEKKDVERFEKLHIQIKDMYSELSILSKKSPDGAINKFKLNCYYSALGIRKAPPLKKEPVSSPEILSVYFPAAASPSA